MFEVQDLKYATLATVSRCGMLWFSSDVVSSSMVFTNYLQKLKNIPLDEGDEEVARGSQMFPAGINKDQDDTTLSPSMQVQHDCVDVLKPFFTDDGLVVNALAFASRMEHIMDFTNLRALSSLFSMLSQGVRNIHQYNSTHPDFPMKNDVIEK